MSFFVFFVFLSFYRFVFMSFCIFVFLSFCLFFILSFCLSVLLSFCLFVFLSFCLFVFLFRHHFDQMSEGSEVSKVTLCVKIQKWHWVSHWPTDWPRSGIELPGQLKKSIIFFKTFFFIFSTVRCSILHPTRRYPIHPIQSTCSTTVLHPSLTCYFFQLIPATKSLRLNVWWVWSLESHSLCQNSKVAVSESLTDSLTKVRYRAARAAKKDNKQNDLNNNKIHFAHWINILNNE